MRRIATCIPVLALVLTGCAATRYDGMPAAAASAESLTAPPVVDGRASRKLIWTASLGLQVRGVADTVTAVTAIAEGSGGYVESSQSGDYDNGASGRLTVRVPAASLNDTIGKIEALGKLTHKDVSSEDVIAECVDLEARLKNKLALRDRLKQLLEKAGEVEDVLAIETELSRTQADIDAMQARLKTLGGQVELATVHVSLERKKVLGPLGLAFKGLAWGIGKLFVLWQ